MNLTPPSWRFSCGLGEDPCEMALVGESAPEGYFNQREICHEHQILGHVDAPLHQPAMWRNSSAASKCSGKVADGKPALAGNLSQRELSIEICVDRISREPQLPRSQPSTHQGSRKTHAAIDACKVYIQRGRDLINELVVGAVMPFDSRYQTVAEVQNDRIAGGDAGWLSDDVPSAFRKFLHEAPHEWSPEVMAELRRLMPRGIFNTMSIVGTAKQVVERLKSLASVGVQEAIMWPFPKPGQEVEDLLIQLGHEVLPHVSERPKREAYRLVD